MDVKKLNWCCKQNRGIKIIEPNENLAKEFMQSAEETLLVLQNIKEKSNMWLATTKYYCEYFAIYALLQRIGIKCEIHDCTIEICKLLENEGILSKEFSEILENDKELRIDNQYYLRNKKIEINYQELRTYMLNIKNKINSISLKEIMHIREKLSRFYREDKND